MAEVNDEDNNKSLSDQAEEVVTEENSPPQPKDYRPQTKPRGDREVSFGVVDPTNRQANTANIADEEDNQSTESPQLKLTEIMKSSPLEDEAEYYLQKTLDEVIPQTVDVAQVTKLLDIPKDAEGEFFDRQQDALTSDAKSNDTKLYELAAEMDRMQVEDQVATEGFGLFASTASLEPIVLTDADRLVQNATQLTHRVKPSKATEGTEAAAATTTVDGERLPETEPLSTPQSRWTKLRAATFLMAASDKKNEDGESCALETDAELGILSNDEDENNSDSDSSSEGADILGNFFSVGSFVKSDLRDFDAWVKLRRRGAFFYAKVVLLYVMIPCTALAALLFYAFDNPPCGSSGDKCVDRLESTESDSQAIDSLLSFLFGSRESRTSVSYWLLFVGVRQVITWCLAHMMQAFIVDFICLRTRFAAKVMGPYLTLWTVQSRGWPFIVTWWALIDFMLLYGDHNFARHWFYWQNGIALFNTENPSGDLPSDRSYLTLLSIGIGLGVATTAKRLWVGLFLGRQTFERYAEKLKEVMQNAILIGQVSTLARDIRKRGLGYKDYHVDDIVYKRVRGSIVSVDSSRGGPGLEQSTRSIATNLGNISEENRLAISELLGAWEEPKTATSEDYADIGAIIQFRRTLSCLNASFPFSVAFGRADTRERCVLRSERLFNRLRGRGNKGSINFDVIALAAVSGDGALDEEKLKKLVKLFRPSRDGTLSLLDFAKSIDSVYKEIRVLRAAVSSSSRMDEAFERFVNIVFYIACGCAVLYSIGIDPFLLFTSLSSSVVAFAFAFGSAASKYFEGILLVLVRKPYSVGDRVHLSNVERDTSGKGSPTWIVKDVSLFSTTMLYAATNEVATYSNGSLASSRIINAARSPQAYLHTLLKFPLNTPYEKLQRYREVIENFVRNRPREWLSFAAFRTTRIEADQGFVEYILVAQHRESWQQVKALLSSLADLTSFALEVAIRMEIQYRAPRRPVDLRIRGPPHGPDASVAETKSVGDDLYDFSALQDLFSTTPPT